VTVGEERISLCQRERVTLLAFVRGGQPQSQLVLRQLHNLLEARPEVQAVILLSGPSAPAQVESVRGAAGTWPIVLDPDFAISGKLAVHAWPTAVLVAPDGRPQAHVAGASQSLQADLAAHLDFLAGRLSAEQLAGRLKTHEVVADSSQEAAARRLQVARGLMHSGQFAAARAQIEEGLKLDPKDAGLRLALARVQLVEGDAAAAARTLDAIDPAAASAGMLQTLRGRAAIAGERWADARRLLEEATRLNPDPAEAWYLLGIVYGQSGDFSSAARAYRQAFESVAGDEILLPTAREGGAESGW
jgi:thioredoxin-like negative regulator of GroEL